MHRKFIPVIAAAVTVSVIIGIGIFASCNKREQVESSDSLIRFESYGKQTVKSGDRIELILATSVTKDSYAGIQADVISNSGTMTAIATKSGTENPWKIEVLNPEFDNDGKVSKNPAVAINFMPYAGHPSTVSGLPLVTRYNLIHPSRRMNQFSIKT